MDLGPQCHSLGGGLCGRRVTKVGLAPEFLGVKEASALQVPKSRELELAGSANT